MPDPTKKISIAPARPDEADVLLGLYAHVMHRREPLTKHMGLSEGRLASLARAMYRNRRNRSLERGLWWLAKDESAGGAAVGFAVCGDILEDNPDEPPKELTAEELAKVPSLIALLEDIRKPLTENGPLQEGECFHVAGLGVMDGYGGMGIATRLLEAAVASGAEAGFRVAASVSTGAASRRCHEKCGFACLRSVRYARFEFEGGFPFSEMEGECYLMVKELGGGGLMNDD